MMKPMPPDVAGQREKLFALMLEQEGIERSDCLQQQPRPDHLPVSFAQQRLWFLHQFESNKSLYNIPRALQFNGILRIDVLQRAMDEMVRRHEALRTSFTLVEGEPTQVIDPPRPVHLSVIDLQERAAEKQQEEIKRHVQEQVLIPFELTRSPLMRSALLRASANDHVLVLVFHHIISDGWSLAIFARELTLFYNAFAKGEAPPLKDLEFQYTDYSLWQRKQLQGAILSEQVGYWRTQLAGMPEVLLLPTDRLRQRELTYACGTVKFEISKALTAALHELCAVENTTLFMPLLAAFQLLLSRYTGQKDIVVGTPIAGRNRSEVEKLIGLFVNTLILRTDLSRNSQFRELLGRVRETTLAAYAHQDLPFEKLVEELAPERDLSRTPLFQVMFMMQNMPRAQWAFTDLEVTTLDVDTPSTGFDLTLVLEETLDKMVGSIVYNSDLFDRSTIERMAGHLDVLLQEIVREPERHILDFPLLTANEMSHILSEWNQTDTPLVPSCMHEAFEQQALKTPEAIAVEYEGAQLDYRELNERSNRVAHYLRKSGVGPEIPVAICTERSIEMLLGLLGILKAGGAYVPLDPEFPAERIAFMLQDSGVTLLLTQRALTKRLPHFAGKVVELDGDWVQIEEEPRTNPGQIASPENAAYVIYTSGSTGWPKGVIVTHRNVSNYFSAMNSMFGNRAPGEWVAVTSICFDISVMELFWTLAHGDHVRIHPGLLRQRPVPAGSGKKLGPIDFSLFFFAAEQRQSSDPYKLLLGAARFADKNGFCAIWTPERHFHAFGGIYPNPAVTGAAIAAATKRVNIRAGSVVAPLHDPLRIAEEWSVVDNLSGGRVSVSFASGWHANDFVLAPEHFNDRKQFMIHQIETIRSVWRGESVTRKNGDGRDVQVRIYPHPVQKELPIWITAAGSTETFRLAGELGAGLLTHLLGQDLEQLNRKIEIYRAAYREAGHPGNGHVALMLHTFVGQDMESTRSIVQGPFCVYLEQSLDLLQGVFSELGVKADLSSLSRKELDAVLLHAFERYFHTSSLMGDEAACWEMLQRLSAIEVDEVACLIDFGVAIDTVIEGLSHLATLKTKWNRTAKSPVRRLEWTNQDLQCTPTFAMAMLEEWKRSPQLPILRTLLIGGEALSDSLARDLTEVAADGVYNMYGPTETTIWSSVHRLVSDQRSVPLGRPIRNTQIYVLDENLLPVPIGITGEAYIGGFGVARGYWNRPGLTAEKFVPNRFSKQPGERLYRTGDLMKWRADSSLEFVGRIDHQIKLRGFRVELGEIESVLCQHPAVTQAVAMVHQDQPGNQRLVAYLVARPGGELEIGDVRAFLKQKLPGYMEPTHYMILVELPLTPNGKIDRRRLPVPAATAPQDQQYVAPVTPVQESLAAIWAKLLKVDRVGIEDNFFRLGGHSLLLIQVIARIRDEFGIEIPLRSFFERPTVSALAELIDGHSVSPAVSKPPRIEPFPRNGSLPLSREEEVLWLLAQLSPDYEGLHTALAWRVRGNLDLSTLEKSVNCIVQRHENLRTTFATRAISQHLLKLLVNVVNSSSGKKPTKPGVLARRIQKLKSGIRHNKSFIGLENKLARLAWGIIGQPFRVISSSAAIPLAIVDLQEVHDREQEASRAVKEEAHCGFDLVKGPLVRMKLIRLDQNDQIFMVTLHHLVCDGWSMAVFSQELRRCYLAFHTGALPELPDLPFQYADYAAWRRKQVQGEVFEKLVAYWKERLKELPSELPLPTDGPRPNAPSLPSATVTFTIAPREARGLKDLSRQEGTTLFLVLLSVFQLLLYRLSGLDDIAVAITVAERGSSELQRLIGFFVGLLVVRTDLSGNLAFSKLLKQVSQVTLEAFEHQESSAIAEALMREIGVQEYARLRGSTFKAFFTWVNVPKIESVFPDLEAEPFPIPEQAAEIGPDVVLQGWENNEAIELRVIYKKPLFSPARMKNFTEQFNALVRQVIRAPHEAIIEYSLQTAAEPDSAAKMASGFYN